MRSSSGMPTETPTRRQTLLESTNRLRANERLRAELDQSASPTYLQQVQSPLFQRRLSTEEAFEVREPAAIEKSSIVSAERAQAPPAGDLVSQAMLLSAQHEASFGALKYQVETEKSHIESEARPLGYGESPTHKSHTRIRTAPRFPSESRN